MSDEAAKKLAEMMDAAIMQAMSPAQTKQRQTALRLHGTTFETVELDDNGLVIEPIRCTCGRWSLIHRSNCPLHVTS